MNHEEFWNIVNAVAATGKDPEAKCDLLKRKLSTLTGSDVFAFSRILTEYRDQAYRWDIWAIAYIVGGGCSDDAFDDFRHSQIFRGRESFERLLANPDSMADESFKDIEYECFFEGYQYIPDEVCEEMTDFQYPLSLIHI